MRKTIIALAAAAVAITPAAAFAQGASKYAPGQKMQDTTRPTSSPGASSFSPGHKMQNSKTSTAPGASEYAPGTKMNDKRGK